ncbi:hypothetical protein [Streptomyces sp. NPDC050738]|uniref:hypothetical protein n=1 Tax=Streptomyces sp. NPDC050738 TaxID=3154744 RepID=UPI003439FFE7
MRVLTSRPKRVIAATALFSAITLTGVGAAQATASPTHGGGSSKGVGEAFSSCMREHGLKNFPDVAINTSFRDSHAKAQVAVKINGEKGPFDPTSKAYKRAFKKCGPILEKAGVPFPATPSAGGPHCKVIKGGKGEPGLPQLPKPSKGGGKGPVVKHFAGPGKGGSEKGSGKHREICVIQEKRK